MHGLTLGGAFTAISQGISAGIVALILGLQPIVTSILANRLMDEKITRLQSVGLALGLVGVLLVLHDRNIMLAGSVLGWVASLLSLIGITLGTLYQKRYCGSIDWRTGNLVQYIGAGVLFALGAFAFETRNPLDRRTDFRNDLVGARTVDRSGCVDVFAYPPLWSDRVCKSVLSGAGRDCLARLLPFR